MALGRRGCPRRDHHSDQGSHTHRSSSATAAVTQACAPRWVRSATHTTIHVRERLRPARMRVSFSIAAVSRSPARQRNATASRIHRRSSTTDDGAIPRSIFSPHPSLRAVCQKSRAAWRSSSHTAVASCSRPSMDELRAPQEGGVLDRARRRDGRTSVPVGTEEGPQGSEQRMSAKLEAQNDTNRYSDPNASLPLH